MAMIHPIQYRIRLTPDLDTFQFKGQVTISFTADAPVNSVELNLLELAVWQCGLEHEGQWIPLSFSVDPAQEILRVDFPEPLQDDFNIRIDYDGLINDKMAGFYRSRFTHEGDTRYIAVTQFQESSARQAFPCMDHPLHKAVFKLELIVPQTLVPIANTLPMTIEPLGGEGQRVVFEPSPKMSTYLVFFGVGAFEQVQDEVDSRVRLIHLPGLAHTTELGLTFGRQALLYCEDYYGIPYPLSKMDLIAVPDFAFGAMENWGAITFRENLLLYFADLTSKAGVQRICEVIAHEIAHQWFGNLVTPEDWKYLWLNESFATYFGYGAVAHYYPQWAVWQQFLNTETATALARDGLKETFAIEIPGGAHVVINSSTAPIIYNKGASILRMIEGYIGSDNYRDGVRAFLKDHSYACAQSRDLWQAFETASAQPITAMMQSWIGQPGHPLVTVQRDGETLTLSQERFTYLKTDHGQTWIVPITLSCWDSDGRPTAQSMILDSATTTVDLPAGTASYKLNHHQTGFFRTHYADEDNLAALARGIAACVMAPEDRWGIQNDLYALVRQGTVPLCRWLSFLQAYAAETDYLPLTSICNHLWQVYLIGPQSEQPAVAELGRTLAGNALKRMGLEPLEEEPYTDALLREQLLWQAAAWNEAQATAYAEDQFNMLLSGKSVHPDIAKAVMLVGARRQGQPAMDWFLRRFAQSPSEHDRLNILMALGAFQDWALIEQALTFTLEQVPPRNRYLTIAAAATNSAAIPHLWDWYQDHLPSLEAFHPLLYERVITSVWPHGGLGREAQVRQFGEQYIRTHPHLTDAVKLAVENLAINAQMRG